MRRVMERGTRGGPESQPGWRGALSLRGAPAIALKELRLLVREPRLIAIQVVFPLLSLLVVGELFRALPEQLPLAVEDRQGSPDSRALLRQLRASGHLRLLPASSATVAPAALVLARNPRRQGLASIRLDASQLVEARAIEAYMQAFDREPGATPTGDPQLRLSVWHNPELRDELFFVPGALALLLFVVPVLLTATCVVRERVDGSWRTLASLPLSDLAIVVGKLAPYTAQACLIALLVFGLARLAFDLPCRGPALALAGITAAFLLGGCALGLILSCVARSESIAWFLARVLVVLPAFAISGFVFPLRAMPRAAQVCADLFPLRYYLELCRAVLVRGASPLELPGHVAVLGSFVALSVLLATLVLRRRRRARR